MPNFTFSQGGTPTAAGVLDVQQRQMSANTRLFQPGSLGTFTQTEQQMRQANLLDQLQNAITTINNRLAVAGIA